jgi:RNA polymerase sigma factor (sigma-70 family)
MIDDNSENTAATRGMTTWDQQWLGMLKAMHEDAWDEFVRSYGADLRRDIGASLKKRGLPADMIEDVEQETWRIAIQKIGEFEADHIDKLYNWLRVIALNRVRMILRRQKDVPVAFEEIEEQEQEGGISLDHFIYMHELSASSPEAVVLLRERLSALETALQELSLRDREILLRRLLDGEMPRDMAAVYALSPRSISMILLRAKQTLERHVAAMQLFNQERNTNG